jgi:hypothetical protein
MADKFRFYILCPSCSGTGLLTWGTDPQTPGTTECPTCKDDIGNPLAPVVYDGLRHVYGGRFEEVEDE